jgi:hypothetical protein
MPITDFDTYGKIIYSRFKSVIRAFDAPRWFWLPSASFKIGQKQLTLFHHPGCRVSDCPGASVSPMDHQGINPGPGQEFQISRFSLMTPKNRTQSTYLLEPASLKSVNRGMKDAANSYLLWPFNHISGRVKNMKR